MTQSEREALAAQYRSFAKAAALDAQKTQHQANREEYWKIAQAWRSLADQVEKISN